MDNIIEYLTNSLSGKIDVLVEVLRTHEDTSNQIEWWMDKKSNLGTLKPKTIRRLEIVFERIKESN